MAAVSVVLMLGSCASSKNVAYFQNADSISLAASKMLYDAKIMPKDQLTITVNTTDPEAAKPFNLAVSQTLGTNGQISTGGGNLQTYLVDNQGRIDFPVVGSLHVGGLTKTECEALIREKGEKHIYRLNLNDANIINSPYYYLQQNDILYVEPNSVKTQNASIGQATQLWFSFASILTSVAALVVNILK